MAAPAVVDPTSNVLLSARAEGGDTGIRDTCGCTMGARCMTVGLLAALAWIGARHGVFTSAFAARLPLVLAVVLVSGGIGKAVGIVTARGRDRRETERLVRAIRRAQLK